MFDVTIELEQKFVAKARGNPIEVDIGALPKAALRKVFEYGMQRILNDACAGAKDNDEAVAMAEAKLDNLMQGILRASASRETDPVRAEAKRIASAMVAKAPGFAKWLAANGFKKADKEAKAKLAELAEELATREDIQETARNNVAATRALDIEIEI